jgi:hypothetical protein
MAGDDKRIDQITDLFKAAHRQSETPVLDQSWRDGIMREVRGLAAENHPETGWLERLFPGPLLFHFAGTSGLAAAAAAVFLAAQGGLTTDVFRLMASYPAGLLQLALLAL